MHRVGSGLGSNATVGDFPPPAQGGGLTAAHSLGCAKGLGFPSPSAVKGHGFPLSEPAAVECSLSHTLSCLLGGGEHHHSSNN